MRLLFCDFCRTCEEIPDYLGSDPVDPLIEEIVMRHNVRDPLAHGGQRIHHSPMRILHFSDEDWARSPQKCLELAAERNKTDGLTAWAYEARSTFGEDALKCFSRHGRPKEGCHDYKDDSKRLGRPTPDGRRVARSNAELDAATPFLCSFCPVESWVTMRKRDRAGMYK